MAAVLDTGFSLSYRDQVLKALLPLFPPPSNDTNSPFVHSLTRLLVTLSDPSLTVPLLTSLVPEHKLLAYQFAFDLAEGGAQDYLEAVRNDLPTGEGVWSLAPNNKYLYSLYRVGDRRDIFHLPQNSWRTGIREALPRVPQTE